MKTSKILITLTLVLGVLTLSNCKKNEAEINPSNQIKLTINTSSVGFDADTKTLMDGVTPKWVTGDKIGVIPNDLTANAEFTSTLSSDKTTASFTGTTTLVNGANTIYAYYPYSTLNGTANKKTSTKLALPTEQYPTTTSFDGAADIMVGKPYTYNYSGSGNANISDFQFMRLMSVLKIVVTVDSPEVGEKVEKVTFIAGSTKQTGSGATKALSGPITLNLIDGTYTFEESTKKNYVIASYMPSDYYTLNGVGAASYLMVNPTTFGNGDTWTFEIETSKRTFKKSVSITEDRTFVAGKIHQLNVALSASTHVTRTTIYDMNSTKLSVASNQTDWVNAGWTFTNLSTVGGEKTWGVKLGTNSKYGAATSPTLTAFSTAIRVNVNALAWYNSTPKTFKLYVTLVGGLNTSKTVTFYQTISTDTGTPDVPFTEIMAERATLSVDFTQAEANGATKVKVEMKSDSGDKRFFLARVKIDR